MAKIVDAAHKHGCEVHPIPKPGEDVLDLLDEDVIKTLFRCSRPRGRPSCSRRLRIKPQNVLCQHLS
jgi:hypothetical protein